MPYAIFNMAYGIWLTFFTVWWVYRNLILFWRGAAFMSTRGQW